MLRLRLKPSSRPDESTSTKAVWIEDMSGPILKCSCCSRPDESTATKTVWIEDMSGPILKCSC